MRDRTAARLAWSLFGVAVVTVVAFVVAAARNASVNSTRNIVFNAQGAFTALVFPAVGAVVASRRKDNPIGWIFIVIGVSAGLGAVANVSIGDVAPTRSADSAAQWAIWASSWVWVPGFFLRPTFLLLLFPDGRLPSRRWRPVAWAAGAGIGLSLVGGMLSPDPGTPGYRNPLVHLPPAVDIVLLLGLFLAGVGAVGSVVALGRRYRRSAGAEREQLKWFVYAGVATIALIYGLTTAAKGPFLIMGFVSTPLLPVAAAIAILQYRLYDIEVVITKTVLYGLLAAFFTAVYVAIVIGVGAVLGSRSNSALTAAAAVVIAVAFNPVRQRARHLANRIVYGDRATPYEVLSEVSERMAGSMAAEEVLPRLARVLAEGTGARRAEVWLRVGGMVRREAAWPDGDGDGGGDALDLRGQDLPPFEEASRAVAVRHQGELLGALTVTKAANDPITPAEEKLLADLAPQVGLVLRNVRLIEELRASRQRIVAAQDEERRRLERNLHDGAQQQLVALAVKQRLAALLVRAEPEKAETMLGELSTDTQEALENLRDLARGIYPPVLADQGLGAALGARARKAPLPVALEAGGIGRHRQDVEAAVYFCCLEALQNIAKYAEASGATVRLWEEDGELAFSVTDDGRGFDAETTAMGSGLQNMADRLAALEGTLEVESRPGKGTTVTGRLPSSPRRAG